MHICKLLSCFCSLSLACGIFPEAVTQCAFVVVVNDKPRFSLDFCLNLFVVFFEPGLGSGINKYHNCYCKCIPIGQIDIFNLKNLMSYTEINDKIGKKNLLSNLKNNYFVF